MVAKQERPISGGEKAALFVLALIAVASWFGEGVAWYQPLLFFAVSAGVVVWIGDAVYKRQSIPVAAVTNPAKSPAPASTATPRKAPRYSDGSMAASFKTGPSQQQAALPDVSGKSNPGDVVVCLHGLDLATTERLDRLCRLLGFSTILQASSNADLAVIGPDSAFDFAAAGVPVFTQDELSDVLHRTLDKFAINIEAAIAQPESAGGIFHRKPTTTDKPSVAPSAASSTSAPRRTPEPPKPTTAKKAIPARKADAQLGTSTADLIGVYTFAYERSNGDISARRVKVLRGTFARGAKYFAGVCLDANASRTFRVDRIIGKLTNEDTGEMFDPAALYSAFEKVGQTRQEVHFLNGGTSGRPTTRTRTTKTEWATAVFFAGFRGSKLDELERLANASGWQVRGSITHTLDYVVRNGSAGKKQLADADNLGISVINEDEFRLLV